MNLELSKADLEELQTTLEDLDEAENRVQARRTLKIWLEELDRREQLEARAGEWEMLPEYVASILSPETQMDYHDLLEKTLDDLDRGYSDTMEEYHDWKLAREGKELQARKNLLNLFSAADLWREHREEQLKQQISRGEQVRIEVEAKRLQPALDWAWEQIR